MDVRLTEYEPDVYLIGPEAVYEPITFSGTAPLLKQNNKTVCVLRQSGRAVVWFGKLTPPAPLVTPTIFLAMPEIKIHRVKDKPWAYETTWNYVFVVPDNYVLDVVAAHAWPSTPVIT